MEKYKPNNRDEFILEEYKWIRGFVRKEYGDFVSASDQSDLRHEGVAALCQIYDKLAARPARFDSRDEFLFYVKAVVRNAVRDFVLRERSRFDISLFKLRRHLRENDLELGEFMIDIGDQYAYQAIISTDRDEEKAHFRRQRRLSLLSEVEKSGRGMSLDECREVLKKVVVEYKKHLEDNAA